MVTGYGGRTMGILYSKADDPGLDAAIERALAEGLLTIVRPGKPSMVMLSATDYERLRGELGASPAPMPGNLIQALLRPVDAADIDFDEAIGERHGRETRKPVDFGADPI
jgi:PHD/YefM family antitoxin component YafN of YafNO toxin-antitoxin module